jgi:hypothetical protein
LTGSKPRSIIVMLMSHRKGRSPSAAALFLIPCLSIPGLVACSDDSKDSYGGSPAGAPATPEVPGASAVGAQVPVADGISAAETKPQWQGGQQSRPSVPEVKLTGDREKDKALVIAALKRIAADLEKATKEQEALRAAKRPDTDPAYKKIDARVTELQAKTDELRTLLDRLRSGGNR